ncbi:MAG: GPW/gp25 family protein [Flavobacteriales bacterium]|nr:GPW/gp25 family protein [Flavobacteriales bacterium]
MENFTSFLGTGWSFPPRFEKRTNKVALVSDEEDIHESLMILLSTRPGERVMNPLYGCNLDDLIFSPLNLTLKTYVANLIETAILYFEPRIDLDKVQISENDDLEGELLIELNYRIRSTNTRRNLVYPFYRGEATDI